MPGDGVRCRDWSPVIYGLLLAVVLQASLLAGRSEADPLPDIHQWSGEALKTLRSLSLSSLPPLPKDPSNAYQADARAIEFGKSLFFDQRLSANGKVSCATCHLPNVSFTDRLPLAKGMGTTTRRTMPLIGVAYHASFFWDGRKDSLWSQAIGPIESSVEHGATRSMCAHLITDKYRKQYEEIFGTLPKITHKSCPPQASPGTGNPAAIRLWNAMKPGDRDAVNRIYANLGKAIAAYVSRILPQPAPFDRYVDAIVAGDPEAAAELLAPEAIQGLRLFIGKAKCTNCHMGPLFTNSSFHNIGLAASKKKPQDRGRADGINLVLADEFNCLGSYSDAKPDECTELRFLDRNTSQYVGAFKTPTLRNVADRSPYMHAGQMKTLADVLIFYQQSRSRELGHQNLTAAELLQLEAFLKTLSSPLAFPQ
ncbi:MAG: cytochrome-c peroxidase [Thermodesulfovibrio sp.]|nr:cytochrome-c peroxidase [Thermodesulfovibrio sp.]